MPRFIGQERMMMRVEKLIAGGWKYEGSHYVFDKNSGKHHYEIRLNKNGKKPVVIASRTQYPYVVDAENNIVKNDGGRGEGGIC